jgi:uncharacterized Fe-S center protein
MIGAELPALNCIERGSHEQKITRAGAEKIIFETRRGLTMGLRLLAEGRLAQAESNEAAHIVLISPILSCDNLDAEAA